MEKRIALIGMIVEEHSAVATVNELLSAFGDYIVGRMGIPYRERNISVISIVIDADSDTISALTGKLGMIAGISVKTVFTKN